MSSDIPWTVFQSVRVLQEQANEVWLPPKKLKTQGRELVLDGTIVEHTRGYIEQIAREINLSFEVGAYNACLVMMRRLLETLIIEVFERFDVSDEIQNEKGEFLYLGELVIRIVDSKKWNIGRETKQILPRLKQLGNRSAHSRRYVANRADVEKHVDDYRVVVQELLFLAGLA